MNRRGRRRNQKNRPLNQPANAAVVSIIIPSYNHAHYLSHTLRSVLVQTYDDWEAIIVDDGSTDDTSAVVAQFADPRVRYIHQQNRGLPAARNAGIAAAQGSYLAFLDADDEWEPDFLARCTAVLERNAEAAGVYTGHHYCDETGLILPQSSVPCVPADQLRRRLLEGGFFPPCAVVVRADAVREAGLFDTSLAGRGVEDWDLWLRITRRHPMLALPEPIARYRVHPGSMSTNAAAMHAGRLSAVAKHLGPPEGEPTSWPEEKRIAYGFADREAALAFIAQGQPDAGWRQLAAGAAICPEILARPDTFYELVCMNQPRGHRGQAHLLDITAKGSEMLCRLEAIFAEAAPHLRACRGQMFGNAHLALAMLADQAQQWRTARHHLRMALGYWLPFALSPSFVRRLLKVSSADLPVVRTIMTRRRTRRARATL